MLEVRGCERFFGPAMRPGPGFSVLHQTHPAQPLLGPRLLAASQKPVRHATELGGRDVRLVAMVEDLVPEPSEVS